MTTVSIRAEPRLWCALVAAIALGMTTLTAAQAAPTSQKAVTTLEKDFFAALRSGNSSKVLSYIPERGVEVGADAQHETRDQIEQQFRSHRGLYCKLFDSSCIDSKIALDASVRSCSYRELLTNSQQVHTAASTVTRSGVEQAVLVARIQNSQCPNQKLIDFIFNLEADGWKLFSIP